MYQKLCSTNLQAFYAYKLELNIIISIIFFTQQDNIYWSICVIVLDRFYFCSHLFRHLRHFDLQNGRQRSQGRTWIDLRDSFPVDHRAEHSNFSEKNSWKSFHLHPLHDWSFGFLQLQRRTRQPLGRRNFLVSDRFDGGESLILIQILVNVKIIV